MILFFAKKIESRPLPQPSSNKIESLFISGKQYFAKDVGFNEVLSL